MAPRQFITLNNRSISCWPSNIYIGFVSRMTKAIPGANSTSGCVVMCNITYTCSGRPTLPLSALASRPPAAPLPPRASSYASSEPPVRSITSPAVARLAALPPRGTAGVRGAAGGGHRPAEAGLLSGGPGRPAVAGALQLARAGAGVAEPTCCCRLATLVAHGMGDVGELFASVVPGPRCRRFTGL